MCALWFREGFSIHMAELTVIGGGLAGSEAAWQAAQRGVEVLLYEMRPEHQTPAHQTGLLAELVCSNSLGSDLPDRAPGVLKEELRRLGSLILACADETAVPAGGALAVGREGFARQVTRRIESHPHITVRREEVKAIPSADVVIVATGPLTSEPLAREIAALTGQEHLAFYDAMAPIVEAHSINMDVAFRASRYGRNTEEAAPCGPKGDYINCPLSQGEYNRLVQALHQAEQFPLHDFEREDGSFFEACLPVEEIARRGQKALAFGPLRPVGLMDPRTGKRPYAVVQLRQDNLAGTLYNMVGFQTNLRSVEQQRVFRLIPGLEGAEFVRYGQMHRNTFLNAPALLWPTMQLRREEGIFFGGQITGTEGYVASTASGLVAGVNGARLLLGEPLITFPGQTMLGALLHYVTHADPQHFQPMKPNFGLFPPLEEQVRGRRQRRQAHAERARRAMAHFIREADLCL
jgi:methylenetetrahydrofolate--tRNA-(uracil-5-)-methyltransferase